MSVRVRLTRVGSKKNPIWRVVVADQRSPRDGRFIETIGHYNPQTEPSTIVIDRERFDHWVARGAQPSGSVKQLIKAQAKAPPPAPVAEAPAAPAQEPATAGQVPGGEEQAAAAAVADQPAAQAEAPAEPADAAQTGEPEAGLEATGQAEASADPEAAAGAAEPEAAAEPDAADVEEQPAS